VLAVTLLFWRASGPPGGRRAVLEGDVEDAAAGRSRQATRVDHPRDRGPVWQDIAATLRPLLDSPDGSLAPPLLSPTLVTGIVDATSSLKLGHVFVANMTGNVVFLGFGLAGPRGISIWASLTALGSSLVAGVVGGRIGAR
jgi:Protein of unknown function (DUF1275)